MTNGTVLAAKPVDELEDPLAYLPCSTVVAYAKGQKIYDQELPSTDIYLVIGGMVKLSRTSPGGRQVLMDVYHVDEFFGEAALIGGSGRYDQAAALESTKVMMWSTLEIEEIVMRRPRLGLAFSQLLAQRAIELGHRIESFSSDNIARRLARSLIRFSERLGEADDNGMVRMIPFTHELLSQYVGTSREIVSLYMNQFRRDGYLKYSRQGITLYREAFSAWLARESLLSAGAGAAE